MIWGFRKSRTDTGKGRTDTGPLTAEDLVTVAFGRARSSEGYLEGPVDDLLDQLVVEMREGTLTAERLDRLCGSLPTGSTFGRSGYDARQVDDLLDRLRDQLARAESVAPSGAPAAAAGASSALTTPDAVTQQYADESRLQTRRNVWRGTADGTQPQDVALEALVASTPRDVLEIGSGTGEFASRIKERLPDARLVATDLSPRMVELTAGRGIDAYQVDANEFPFAEDEFDAVVAMWVLYHLPDPDRAIAEARRVLRKDGAFLAMTNGDGHLADLLRAAGGERIRTGFSRENGAAALYRHFTFVEQIDFDTRAVFPDHAAAQAYLATFAPDLAEQLPPFEGEREFAGAATLFIAT